MKPRRVAWYHLARRQEIPVSRPGRPHLFSAGTRKFIEVPSDRARSLHAYLCTHCIVCEQPGPSSTGLDVIALGKSTDVKNVRALLAKWA